MKIKKGELNAEIFQLQEELRKSSKIAGAGVCRIQIDGNEDGYVTADGGSTTLNEHQQQAPEESNMGSEPILNGPFVRYWKKGNNVGEVFMDGSLERPFSCDQIINETIRRQHDERIKFLRLTGLHNHIYWFIDHDGNGGSGWYRLPM